MGYHWYEKMSKEPLYRETSIVNISKFILEFQMSMFGNVA